MVAMGRYTRHVCRWIDKGFGLKRAIARIGIREIRTETRGQETANQTSASECMIIFPFPMTLENGSVLDEVLEKWMTGTSIFLFPITLGKRNVLDEVQNWMCNYIPLSDDPRKWERFG